MDDAFFIGDSVSVKLSCAHNHPDQQDDMICMLCGDKMPLKENQDGFKERSDSG